MKILKLTNVYTYYYPQSSYILPSPPMAQGSASSGWFSGLIGSGGSQLQAQGQMQQHSMAQQAQVVQKPPETTRREINIILENMTYFEELKGTDCKTKIHLIGGQQTDVEETCDQIRKMIHGLEFNDKMDDLLK